MPKFIYVGERPDGVSDGNPAASIKMFGLTFPKGEPVEVTDAHAVRKLAWNTYFRPVSDAPALPTVAPEIGAALTEPINALLDEAPAPTRRKRAKKED